MSPWGLPWALSPAVAVLVARAAPRLWSEQSRVLETAPLGFTAKMNRRKWGGVAKEDNPQVDHVLEKTADCSREIIESI